MTTVSDLRRALDDHSADAIVDFAVVAGARSRGLRLRRRRRLLSVGTAGALALAAGLLPVLPVLRDRSAPPVVVGPAVVASPAYRTPAQLGITVIDGSDYVITEFTAQAGQQTAEIRHKATATTAEESARSVNNGADLVVYDPGLFDPSALLQGKQGVLPGRPVMYSLADPPMVGWQEPSGAWAVATGPRGALKQVLRVAADVQMTTPSVPPMPFRFGWVPGGLTLDRASTRWASAQVGFGNALTVSAQQSDDPAGVISGKTLPSPVTIAGHQTWYFADADDNPGGTLMVAAGDCLVQLAARDRSTVPLADVRRMVEAMEFATCADPATWGPPL
ncbi:hypothetical protein FB565_006547 [Actinoplanes lutulentus]|uniref:DUF4367 domain-containing protein n=1 Tax=Actinoplanes lutulentus TaxID=1287878 RepID=A0A327ZHX3_9ACTN|nr:hypothetical protein [Actinoplanes lutulentus]MBB2946779.1 hypothetical protein [Actinoplanes lutulentus]RAK35671.1 hypothetical protein B0I29_109145 [Actinoplanes lutulentus]